MYQKAVKVARIINEIEIENREKGRAKKKFGLGGSDYQGNRNFKWFKPGMNKIKESKLPNEEKGKHVANVGVNTLAHARALWDRVFDVVIWVTKLETA